jgi:hypothetical protein
MRMVLAIAALVSIAFGLIAVGRELCDIGHTWLAEASAMVRPPAHEKRSN